MQHALLQELIDLSARVGDDPTVVQGAGGNSSVKLDDVLWVKASGKWLSAARREPIFVPLNLPGVRRRIGQDAPDPVGPERLEAAGVEGLRPSIETTLHALLPHRVVVHLHSVNTIAWAVRADGAERLAERLAGLTWAWVPYCRPGLPLTQSVARILGERPTDILVMANHGLVVGGADCAAVERLIGEVERRLDIPPAKAPAPDLARLAALAANAPYRLPAHGGSHGIATDPFRRRVAKGGSLYPDHVIFLGPGAADLGPGEIVRDAIARRWAGGFGAPKMLLVDGAGLLVHRDLTAGGEEMVRCLALVLDRLRPEAPVVYLSAAAEAELLGWDAEQYRQSLDRR